MTTTNTEQAPDAAALLAGLKAMGGEGPMPETCPACKSAIGRRTFIYGNTTYWEFDCGVCVTQEPGQPWHIVFADDCEYAFATAVRLQAEHVAAFERALVLRNERDAAIVRATTYRNRALALAEWSRELRRDTDFDAKWEQANKGLVDRLMDLALSRRFARLWKQAAKRWRAIAYDNHLTTADVLTHDAAIQRGDNFATEHSRALLRVGVLEGLLGQAGELLADAWTQFAVPGKGGVLWAGGLSVLEEIETLYAEINAALGKMEQAG